MGAQVEFVCAKRAIEAALGVKLRKLAPSGPLMGGNEKTAVRIEKVCRTIVIDVTKLGETERRSHMSLINPEILSFNENSQDITLRDTSCDQSLEMIKGKVDFTPDFFVPKPRGSEIFVLNQKK